MTVAEIYEKYDVIILHSTLPLGGAGGNKCIDPKSTVAQRIIKAFQTETSISCCSFKSGESLKNIFGPVGLFLCNGDVIAASEFDLGSRINDDCERECDAQMIPINQQVENAISQKTNWNEFLIRKHKEFGIFLCVDDIDYLYQQVGEFDKFHIALKIVNLPYFIINHGQIFEAKFDEVHNIFIKEKPISISQLIMKYCDY